MAIRARDRILSPYTRRVDDWRHALRRLIAIGTVLAVALVYGLAIAILPQQFMTMLLLPLAGLALLALWLAPQLDPPYDDTVRTLYLALMFVTIVWPYYLALDVLGLPWITAGRLAQIMLFVVAGLLAAMSARARSEIREVALAAPLAIRMWLLAFGLVVLTMPLNGVDGFTQGLKFLLATLAMFLIGCLVYRSDRAVLRTGPVIAVAAAIVCLFGIGEHLNGRPLWADHIPSWLKVEEPGVLKFLAGDMRTLDGLPRVGSSFGIPLFFGEFLGMASVFVAHLLLRERRPARLAILGALMFFILVNAHIANARSAWIAIISGLFGYYVAFALNRFFRAQRQGEMISPMLVWGIPASFAFVACSVLFVHRIRVRVLGGGQHSFSDAAREGQWERAWAAALNQPWGHGPGSSGMVIGWGNVATGSVTVDSTHAWLIVDYGFLGLFLFAAAYVVMMISALRAVLGATGEVERMALPAFAVMTTFLGTRYGIASWMNIYLVFAMFALIAAVLWRQRARGGLFDWSELRLLAPTALIARRRQPETVPAPAFARRP